MKIEDVSVTNLHFDYPDGIGFRYAGGSVTSRVTSLVRVTADDGTVGLGASYSHPDLVKLIIEHHFRPHLVGEDPREIERLWERMASLTLWYGRKGVAVSALGGVDIALWDLKGKVEGQPLYRLLGGERGAVEAYASGLFWQDDVDALEREAARHRDAGFRRVKMRLGRSEAYDLAAAEAALRGVGPDGEVMIDGSHRYDVEQAQKLAGLLPTARIFWFEEPFSPGDIDSYASLRPRIDVPLAAGENEFGVEGFRELLRAGAIDIAQPDACRTGGITASMRIAQLAADFGVRICPHTWSDAVALMANAHVVAALPHGVTIEVDRTGNPFVDELLSEPLEIRDGELSIPDAPGLGIDLDMATVGRLEVPDGELMRDGNYSDLVFGKTYLSEAPAFGPIPR